MQSPANISLLRFFPVHLCPSSLLNTPDMAAGTAVSFSLLPFTGIVVYIKVVRDPYTEKTEGQKGLCVPLFALNCRWWQLPLGGCLCRAGVVRGVQPSPLGTCRLCTDSGGCLQTRQSTWLPHGAAAHEETLPVSEGLPQYCTGTLCGTLA